MGRWVMDPRLGGMQRMYCVLRGGLFGRADSWYHQGVETSLSDCAHAHVGGGGDE